MKRLRLCLLVLMAVLLPLRGAMAAAMLCPPSGGGSHMEQRAKHPSGGHPHRGAPAAEMAHGHGSHDHAAHPPGASAAHSAEGPDAQQSDVSASSHDQCDMCSAFCAITPLIGSLPILVVPLLVSSQRYPTLDAPAPLFLSDGQDRPPRST